MSENKDPIDGLIKYVNEIKPFHSKVIEVLTEYIYNESINVSINESLRATVSIIIPRIDLEESSSDQYGGTYGTSPYDSATYIPVIGFNSSLGDGPFDPDKKSYNVEENSIILPGDHTATYRVGREVVVDVNIYHSVNETETLQSNPSATYTILESTYVTTGTTNGISDNPHTKLVLSSLFDVNSLQLNEFESLSANVKLTPVSLVGVVHADFDTSESTTTNTSSGGGLEFNINDAYISPSLMSIGSTGFTIAANNSGTGETVIHGPSDTHKSSGKWYWETVYQALPSFNTDGYQIGTGIVDVNDLDTTRLGGNGASIAILNNGIVESGGGGFAFLEEMFRGSTVRHMLDLDNKTYQAAYNSDPFVDLFVPSAGTIAPAIQAYGGSPEVTIVKFDASEFSYPIPSGYSTFSSSNSTSTSSTSSGNSTGAQSNTSKFGYESIPMLGPGIPAVGPTKENPDDVTRWDNYIILSDNVTESYPFGSSIILVLADDTRKSYTTSLSYFDGTNTIIELLEELDTSKDYTGAKVIEGFFGYSTSFTQATTSINSPEGLMQTNIAETLKISWNDGTDEVVDGHQFFIKEVIESNTIVLVPAGRNPTEFFNVGDVVNIIEQDNANNGRHTITDIQENGAHIIVSSTLSVSDDTGFLETT